MRPATQELYRNPAVRDQIYGLLYDFAQKEFPRVDPGNADSLKGLSWMLFGWSVLATPYNQWNPPGYGSSPGQKLFQKTFDMSFGHLPEEGLPTRRVGLELATSFLAPFLREFPSEWPALEPGEILDAYKRAIDQGWSGASPDVSEASKIAAELQRWCDRRYESAFRGMEASLREVILQAAGEADALRAAIKNFTCMFYDAVVALKPDWPKPPV